MSLFSPTELELLICGLPEVNVNDLCANTEYHQVIEELVPYLTAERNHIYVVSPFDLYYTNTFIFTLALTLYEHMLL